MIFSENVELRLTVLKSLNKIEDPGIIATQIMRRMKSPEFLELEKMRYFFFLDL
jgi:hypothetical protein